MSDSMSTDMSAASPSTGDAAGIRFADLALPDYLLKALQSVGYETPSPIQAQTIPPLLEGRDLLGQAQTGTGKTAAFALPMLAQVDVNSRATQALVLAPTRELAIQVAEAFQKYASHLPGFHVLPIYGGQAYQPQLSALKRGAHVVVGTPGRVMDHLKRGTLNLSTVRMVALDEADEMLNMGFLEDVEWILKHLPEQRQVALFSATMPNQIKRIAQTYLKDPAEILIRSKTTTAANIRQRYWMVSGLHKMDALTRMLEVETFDAMIIFARTKVATEEIAEKLEARGYATAPLNGDIPQQQRERTVQRLRDSQIDIIVATDVAARGLNVERISHVLNYDIPLDIESYVHRIGRTGRAGRSGEAILFVSPREKRMLFSIERATRQPIEHMVMPGHEEVNNQRIMRFKQKITETLEEGELDVFRSVVEQYETEHNVPAIEVAAALARMAHEAKFGQVPLLLMGRGDRGPRVERESAPRKTDRKSEKVDWDIGRGEQRPARSATPFVAPASTSASVSQPIEETHAAAFTDSDALDAQSATAVVPAASDKPRKPKRERDADRPVDEGFADERRPPRAERARETPRMDTYRVAVGHEHQVKPGNIVGAIANEAGIDSRHIGRIQIFDNYSLVDLPEGMPREVLQHLKKVWVAGQELRISLQRPEARGEQDAFAERPAREDTGFRARRDAPKSQRRDRDFSRDTRPTTHAPARFGRSDAAPGAGSGAGGDRRPPRASFRDQAGKAGPRAAERPVRRFEERGAAPRSDRKPFSAAGRSSAPAGRKPRSR